MLTTIKGIYENGIIEPLEKLRVKSKAEVIIIFLDTVKEKKSAFLSTVGSRKDVDTEVVKKQIYEEKFNKSIDIEQLTLGYIAGKIEQKGSIDEIKINSKKIEQAIYKTFGTNDPIKLIDMIRR